MGKEKIKVATLYDYVREAMTNYATEVLEQRMVPDFRDGLKPVHRSIIWAMYQGGMTQGSLKKCARAVGDAMSKFHPHGDGAIFDALVRMAGVQTQDKKAWVVTHVPCPLIEGQGNFGSAFDNSAAMRYIEACLSKFSHKYLLDKDYLDVTDFIPNYSQDETIPLIFPARVPLLLLNGSSSIAVGLSASCPSFAPEGVLELCRIYLKTGKVTYKDALKHLVHVFAYGGACVSDREALAAMYKTGAGSLQFSPTFEEDQKNRTLYVTSLCRGFSTATNLAKMETALCARPDVLRTVDETSKHGFRYKIVAQRSIKAGPQFDKFVEEIKKLFVFSTKFDIGVTERRLDKVRFMRMSIPEFIRQWCDWRVALEKKVFAHRIKKLEADKRRLELVGFAASKLDILFLAVKSNAPVDLLVKRLKVDAETAQAIMRMQLQQLAKVEQDALKEQIAALAEKIKAQTKQDPVDSVIAGFI